MIRFRKKYLFMQSFRFLPMIFFLLILFIVSNNGKSLVESPNSSLEIISSPFFIMPFLFGLFCITYHEGFEFDSTKKIYRNFIFVLGFRIGSWSTIPKFDYFLVTRYSLLHNSGSFVQSFNVSGSTCFLYGCEKAENEEEDDYKMFLSTNLDEKKCISIAKQLNNIYSAKIYDYTGRELIEVE